MLGDAVRSIDAEECRLGLLWGEKSVGGGELAGLLDCHLLFVALDDPFTSFGAQDHAPADLALVSSPQLISHSAVRLLFSGRNGPARLGFPSARRHRSDASVLTLRLLAHGFSAAHYGAVTASRHNELGAALLARVPFARLVGQLPPPIDVNSERMSVNTNSGTIIASALGAVNEPPDATAVSFGTPQARPGQRRSRGGHRAE